MVRAAQRDSCWHHTVRAQLTGWGKRSFWRTAAATPSAPNRRLQRQRCRLGGRVTAPAVTFCTMWGGRGCASCQGAVWSGPCPGRRLSAFRSGCFSRGPNLCGGFAFPTQTLILVGAFALRTLPHRRRVSVWEGDHWEPHLTPRGASWPTCAAAAVPQGAGDVAGQDDNDGTAAAAVPRGAVIIAIER